MKRMKKNFPSPFQDLGFRVYQCVSRRLAAHFPQTEEGHLICGGFPYLPLASGNLKYITHLVELYFKSPENR